MPRTVREFALTPDTWSRIDEWATQERMSLTDTLPMGRIYERRIGQSRALVVVHVSNTETGVWMESWIDRPKFTSIYPSFFPLPTEVPLEPSWRAGFYVVVGLRPVNRLLAALGQPLIPWFTPYGVVVTCAYAALAVFLGWVLMQPASSRHRRW
jgi:hypothetical protein